MPDTDTDTDTAEAAAEAAAAAVEATAAEAAAAEAEAADPTGESARGRVGGTGAVVLTVLAWVTVWLALIMPDQLGRMTPGAFARIPVEGLVIVALALVLPPRGRRPVAVVMGLLLAALLLLKILDLGFYEAFSRPFDPVIDWSYLGPGLGVLGDSTGRATVVVLLVAAAALVVLVVVLMPLCLARLTRTTARHRRASSVAVVSLAVVWMLCAVTGLRFVPTAPVASASAAVLTYDQVSRLRADLKDRTTLGTAIATDPLAAGLPVAGLDRAEGGDGRLLSGLRGKDVLLVFVESYGRVALEDPLIAPGVTRVLADGNERLRAAGFSSRSGYLRSSTFGGASWLAHATLESGLWVSTQQRYNQLVTRDRLTISGAFARAGWRTVFDVPAVTDQWEQGKAFYGFDRLYGEGNVGYRGPQFGYATMPDQFVLSRLRELELTAGRRDPVMAEVDLVSSHYPWTPLPSLVDWDQVGDGSIFDTIPKRGEPAGETLADPEKLRAAYGQSVQYTLGALIGLVETSPDPDLVLVVLGDHQPAEAVSGAAAPAPLPGGSASEEPVSRDVPVTVIAHDPAVLQRISPWNWTPGLQPGPAAPVWRMDAFRDRFLRAFS